MYNLLCHVLVLLSTLLTRQRCIADYAPTPFTRRTRLFVVVYRTQPVPRSRAIACARRCSDADVIGSMVKTCVIHKPEVHYVSQGRHKRTETRSQKHARNIQLNFVCVVSEISARTDRQTHRSPSPAAYLGRSKRFVAILVHWRLGCGVSARSRATWLRPKSVLIGVATEHQ